MPLSLPAPAWCRPGPRARASVSELLRIALDCLLQDLDYEADQTSGGAVAARVIASVIVAADEIAARALH